MCPLLVAGALVAWAAAGLALGPGPHVHLFLRELCPDMAGGGGGDDAAVDAEALQRLADRAAREGPPLAIIPREAVCEPSWLGLPALLNAVLGSGSAGLLGSPPPALCNTVATLAALRATPFVSWSCPQVDQNERSRAQGLASVVPPLAATADAVAAIAKLFRWKSAAILTVEGGWWPRLAHAVDARLRARQVSVRLHAPLPEPGGPWVPAGAGAGAPRAQLLVVCAGAARALALVSALSAQPGRLPPPLQAALLLQPAPLSPPPPPPPALPPAASAALLVLAPEIVPAQPGNLTAATWRRVEAALRLLNGSGSASALRLSFWSGAEGAWRPLLRLRPRGQLDTQAGAEVEAEPLQPAAADWPRLRANLSDSQRDQERRDADAEADAEAASACDSGDLYCDGADGLTEEGRSAHAQQLLLRGAHIAALAVCSALLLAVVAAGAAIGRKQLLKKRMSKGPYKILLTPSDFVFPQVTDSLRVDEGIEAMLCCWLQQLREFGGPEVAERPDLLKGSFGSLQHLARPATLAGSTGSLAQAQARSYLQADTRARYNGDLVQLKELPVQGTFELKSKAMDVLMTLHGLRHENVNPLLGCLVDSSRPALVFEWCSRGSLEDVLVQDEIKLDWSFRLSLLTDLVRGMRYLHTTPVRVHGYLTSRNCVIDARWVLKVTDYGLPAFYDAQNIPPPCKSARDLLWTAPELLRNPGLRKQGSQPGDVYSFGIIMQEVVVRGEPFCMLALSPEEILEKVKRPPPLIRPSVSKGAAPPEAINIMRQCWAEQPDMRPDFGAVHDLFKKLNHGRKVNFVDTMFQMLEKYSNNLEELIRERTEQLDMEKKKTEQLLNRMLPSSVADKLKLGMPVDPEDFREVTIYFSDIVGFTTISAYSTPFQVVDLLNDLYTCFDATINAYNVYKVETIGDAYMVVGGLPVRIPDHADQVATMALDLLHQSGRFRIRHLPGTPLRLRIGLHTGPCCAGVVGLTMPRYCLFGDTVNTASRMESTGSAWRIHLSQATKEQLDKVGGYQLEYRGETDIKGKGKMHTYWLLAKAGFHKELPVPPPIGESHGLDERLIRASRYRAGGAGGSGGSSADRERDRSPQSQQSQGPPQYQHQHQQQQHARSEDGGSSGHASPLPAKSVSTCDLKVRASVHAHAASSAPIDHPVKSASAEQSSGLAATEVAAALLGVSASSLNCRSAAAAAAAAAAAHAHQRRDLSANYNHYRCLSPSEQHLNVPAGRPAGAGGARFLRRQFSLDRGDEPAAHAHHDQRAASTGRLCKQNSAGAAPDLERIEEIPLSAARHHSRLPAFASISVSAESLN